MSIVVTARELTDEDIESIISFYGRGSSEGVAWYRNKLVCLSHCDKIIGSIATDEMGEVVGVYLGIRQRLLSCPDLESYQSIDTLVAEKYRGTLVLRSISRAYYVLLSKMGANCAFGIPNERIKKFREKILGWQKALTLYRFIIPIPIIFFKIFPVFLCRKYLKAPLSVENIDPNLIRLMCNKPINLLFMDNLYCAWTDVGLFNNIGVIRGLNNVDFTPLQKFFVLVLLAKNSKALFFQTYASPKSTTGNFFKGISLSRKSLDLSGKFISNFENSDFNIPYFEFIEFDNYCFK